MTVVQTGPLILDRRDPRKVEGYERAFYNAFRHLGHDPLLRRLWHWDDAAFRLSAHIPYADQVVYIEKDRDGAIDSAIAVNLGWKWFQAETYDFEPPSDLTEGCEILAFFVVSRHALALRYRFWAQCFADLRRRGLAWGLSTTAPRALNFYKRIGAEILRSTGCGETTKYLMKLSFERDYIRPRRAA